MSVATQVELNKNLKGLFANFNFAQSFEGTPFWKTDTATKCDVPAVVHISAKGNFYLKTKEYKGQSAYIGMSILHDEAQTMDWEQDQELIVSVVVRSPNMELTEEDLKRVEALEGFGAAATAGYRQATKDPDNLENQLLLVVLPEEE